MAKAVDKKAYWAARKFLLDMSRGKIDTRACSPYGGLGTDWDAVHDKARKAYEVLLALQPAVPKEEEVVG